MTHIGRLSASVLTASAFNHWASIPAVLVAGVNDTQNSPFSSLAVAVTVASTHCAYSRRDGQAELAWVTGYVLRQFTCPQAVTHPSTNRAQCRATALIKTNALPRYSKPPSLARLPNDFVHFEKKIFERRETRNLNEYRAESHRFIDFTD